jgi:prepilin-type N-terminal cleavage/methylation domain-containing protein
MRPTARPIRRAFTLVELIATMTILAALGSVVSIVIATSVDGYTRAATTAQLNSEISIALDRIDQLLRFIPQSGSGGPDISSLTATSITWSGDWSLTLSGTQLLLTEDGGTPSVLLQDVSSLSVTARDQSNAALAASLSGSACDSIHRVRISITLTRSGVSETLRSRIFIRSLAAGMEG